MSCHEIGRGMNHVAELVAEMYDAKEISKDAAVKLFRRLQEGVRFCDGNEEEAVSCISNRCGICMEKLQEGDALYLPFFDVLQEHPEAASEYLCEACMCRLYGEEGKQRVLRAYGEDLCVVGGHG